MRSRHWGALAVLSALVVMWCVASAGAAPSLAAKAGCPAITRAQADAAIGDVRKIEHQVERIPIGGGRAITYLRWCRIFFGPGFKKTQVHRFGGSLDITLEGGDRRAFNEQRRDYEGLARGGYGGRVETVMGLGTPAFRYSREPSSNEWELYVFHPRLSRQNKDPATKRPMPPAGSFAILPDPSVSGSMPFASHVALARAVLKFPKR
jgi:hypothetical protein